MKRRAKLNRKSFTKQGVVCPDQDQDTASSQNLEEPGGKGNPVGGQKKFQENPAQVLFENSDGRNPVAKNCSSHKGHATCPTCGNCLSFEVHGPFRDSLSFREYQISGMCQKCQDEFFSSDESQSAPSKNESYLLYLAGRGSIGNPK